MEDLKFPPSIFFYHACALVILSVVVVVRSIFIQA